MREDWNIKKLGDVCDLLNGYAFKSKWYVDSSNTLSIRMSNIRPNGNFAPNHNSRFLPDDLIDEYEKYLLSEGDLVIAMTDMADDPKILGLPTIVKDLNGRNFLLNQRVGKLHEFTNDIYVPFLRYYLSTPRVKKYYKSKGAGGVQINIGKKDILSVEIPIPPLTEQKRIVEILDEAFEAINQANANIERNIENAEELFQSKLNEIFSQRGEGWEENMLKEVCEIRPSKRQVKEKLSDGDLVSFVPMSHLEVNKKYFEEEDIKPLKDVYKGYTYFEDGDVLLAKITPCFENGKLGIASSLENGVGFGSTEYIVYRTHSVLLNEFLYYFLNRDSFRTIGQSLMDGAVGHQRIQKEFYEDFMITYPSLDKQEELVREMDNISELKSELISILNAKIKSLEELKKSILQKAFSGELTANEHVAA